MIDSFSTERYTLRPDVVMEVIAGDALLLKLDREEAFALNATGAAIARRLADRESLRAIVEALSREFGVDEATIAADVTALVETLLAKGLIERAEP